MRTRWVRTLYLLCRLDSYITPAICMYTFSHMFYELRLEVSKLPHPC